MSDDDRASSIARPEAEATPRPDAAELRARAARIRQRSTELADTLGADHPLVAEALERAAHLEAEAARPGHIQLR